MQLQKAAPLEDDNQNGNDKGNSNDNDKMRGFFAALRMTSVDGMTGVDG